MGHARAGGHPAVQGMKYIGKVCHLYLSQRTRMLETLPILSGGAALVLNEAAVGDRGASVHFTVVENANRGSQVF